MSSDVMRVRLHLRGVRVLEVVADSPGRLEVAVEATWSTSRCPHCGFKCRGVHDRRVKRVWDQPVSGRETVLLWRRRRWRCENCSARHLEDHPEFEGKLTRRLARRLVGDVAVMPISAAARRAGVSWHLVNDVVRAWAALVGEHRRRRRCRVLLVDETSMRRRHRYVTVIVSGDTGELLAMVPHRSAEALSRFFAAQGHRWCAGVKVVVTDGSKAYKAAVDRHLGHATHVLDRFHVIGWFAAGLTAVRRDVQRRQPAGVTPVFDPEVFRARFLLLRRPDRLDDTQRAQLDGLFEAHPRLRAAWEALGELHGLYLADDKAGALAALDRFTDLYQTGDLPEFYKIVNTLLAAMPRILAWHTAGRPSNGRIEGTNNLLQVLRRTAHGFTNPHNFAARALLVTSTQPTPADPKPTNSRSLGFSRAISAHMPLLDDLGQAVVGAFREDRLLRAMLDRAEIDAIKEGAVPLGDVETWLTSLAADQPFMSATRNLQRRALYVELASLIAQQISEASA